MHQERVIRVLLVDDQPLARLGVSLSLGSDTRIAVVGEAGSGEDAIAAVAELRPDVVVMDVRMPGMGGIEATRLLTAAGDLPRVLVLTSFDLDRFALGALRAGASAFLLKSATPEALVAAVHTIFAGESVVSPRITDRLIRHFSTGTPAPADADLEALGALSPRELDVFLAVATGLSNGEIADRLFLTTSTVKSHINRIFAKLQLRDRVQAVLLAHRLGITAGE